MTLEEQLEERKRITDLLTNYVQAGRKYQEYACAVHEYSIKYKESWIPYYEEGIETKDLNG